MNKGAWNGLWFFLGQKSNYWWLIRGNMESETSELIVKNVDSKKCEDRQDYS